MWMSVLWITEAAVHTLTAPTHLEALPVLVSHSILGTDSVALVRSLFVTAWTSVQAVIIDTGLNNSKWGISSHPHLVNHLTDFDESWNLELHPEDHTASKQDHIIAASTWVVWANTHFATVSFSRLFTCVRYAEARNRYMLDVRPSVRPSVCPSHTGSVSKRLNILSCFLHHTIAHSF